MQLLSAEATRDVPLQRIGTLNPVGASDSRVELPLPRGPVILELAPDVPRPESVEVVDVAAALDSRRAGLVAQEDLSRATVVGFGAGSLGSLIAVPLAQAGVGRLRLVDNDRLDAANVSRHACGLLDLGRAKARALADLLRWRGADAQPIERDILQLTDAELDALLQNADLAVATTDSPAAQFVVNEACVRTGTSALFGGAWELARGGELCVYRPGLTPCYYCATAFRAELSSDLAPKARRQAYQSADANRLSAQPGLGTDIAHLASVAASYALAMLSPSASRAMLLADGRSFVLLHGGSQPQAQYAELFEAPFEVLRARVVRDDPCPVCHWRSDRG